MLTDSVIKLFLSMLSAFFSLFDVVTVLPYGVDSILVTAVGTFRGFANIFPPVTAISYTIIIYIGWRFGLMLFKATPIFGKIIHR